MSPQINAEKYFMVMKSACCIWTCMSKKADQLTQPLFVREVWMETLDLNWNH